MTNYHLTDLTLSTRFELAAQMLDPERRWGLVSELSREKGVSRKFLYAIQAKAEAAILKALEGQKAGRKANTSQIEIDDKFVERAIAILMSVIPGTVRPVKWVLDWLLGIQRSTGYISQKAQKIGAAAWEYTQNLRLPISVLAEADEIFQGQQPCLTLVDGRSFLVLSLSAQEHRDKTTWGCVLLDVQNQGVHFVDVASDGALGIQAGVREVSLTIPLRPDLFHLLREAYRVDQRLENRAYRTIEMAEHARKAQQEQNQPKRRKGAPLKVKLALPEAEIQESLAIEQLDVWEWLSSEIRQALEPLDQHGRIASSLQARQTILTALELLETLNHATIREFTNQLTEKLDDLLAPIEWLEQALTLWREGLTPETEKLILWAWQHQKELEISVEQVLPAQYQDTVCAFWNALSLFHRSSSLAESLHSWLRPYLQVHRGMPKWLLPLLQLVWNHHVFQRGKRQGKSPMAWAGLENVPALSTLFDYLINFQKPNPAPSDFIKMQKVLPYLPEKMNHPELITDFGGDWVGINAQGGQRWCLAQARHLWPPRHRGTGLDRFI
jgi:hypothetical protein